MGDNHRIRYAPLTAPAKLQKRLPALAAGAAAAALLAACVAAQPTGDGAFSAERTTQEFAAGYEAISGRYVDKTAISTVALAGLDGLSVLDPEIAIDRDGDKVEMRRAGVLLSSFAVPGDDDADGWADLTVKALMLGRAASPQVMNASSESIYDAVFDKSLTKLDEFSRYAGRDLARNHRAMRDGFGGIGFEFTVTPNRTMKITSVVGDTPAEHGGLQVGDVVTQIDGRPITDLNRDDITNLLRGRVGTHITLTIYRMENDGPLRLTFERALIVPPTVTAELQGDIAYLTVSSFNQRTAISLSSAFDQLKSHGAAKGVVLDLRGNPGGLLDQAIAVADLFLDSGEIIETHGRHPDSNQRFDASGNDIAQGLPMAVLINGDSASSAEIVAAALQDQRRAVLVGSTSFGKGTVQNVIRLPNDGELTLTWSRIEAPSGYAFHKLGIMPTLCTSKSAESAHDLEADLRSGRIDSAHILAAWRSNHDNTRATDELRSNCPARHDMAGEDLQVAKDVLEDSELYARAMKLSEPAVAQAAGPSVATR